MADVRKIFLDPAKVGAMVDEELKRRKAAPDAAKAQRLRRWPLARDVLGHGDGALDRRRPR